MASDLPADEPGDRPAGRTPLRHRVLNRVRRSRFLPASMVDRVPDESRLDTPLPGRVLVYLPTAQTSLYQLRQWYRPLCQLDRLVGVSCVFRDSRTARIAAAETDLDCLSLGTIGQLSRMLTISNIELILYVNLDPLVFESLRFTGAAHVYLGHGDSDKEVFGSHQVQAFDYYFVAGQAAIDRLRSRLPHWDADRQGVVIGQPQIDDIDYSVPASSTPTVMYAPTWEGIGSRDGYSSVLDGTRIVESLHRSGYRVVYRPHPFIGIDDAAYGAADRRVRDTVERGGGRVDAHTDLATSFSGAWALVTDVSAVVSSWLPSRRPLLVTSLSDAGDDVPADSLTAALPRLTAGQFDAVGERIAQMTSARDIPDDDTIAYWLGDVSPGAPTGNFLDACLALLRAS